MSKIILFDRYGHFSGINRKVQMKYQPKGRPRGSSSDDGKGFSTEQFISTTVTTVDTESVVISSL
jgi:hypothetical protein